MKKAARKKLDPSALLKELYTNTFVLVADVLERNGRHSKNIARAVQTDIDLQNVEGGADVLTPTCTVAEMLKKLRISTLWDDTRILVRMVGYLPEQARILAKRLLKRYNGYLEVFEEADELRHSIKDMLTSPALTKASMSVEVTMAKEFSKFTKKDCKEIFTMLICKAWKIPRDRIIVNGAWSGDSTTVAFSISQVYRQNIILYSFEESTMWFFQELSITRVRIPGAGLFEVNVTQLLAQRFRQAIRNGLTGNMDFVGATKVCGNCELLDTSFGSLYNAMILTVILPHIRQHGSAVYVGMAVVICML